MAYTVYRVQLYMCHGAHQTAISGYSGFLISASVMYSGFMQPCNSSATMGSRYLGYRLVLYTPSICHPVCILGNDYPGMGTVARLHKFTVYGCMHTAWWYICTWEHVAGMGICMQ